MTLDKVYQPSGCSLFIYLFFNSIDKGRNSLKTFVDFNKFSKIDLLYKICIYLLVFLFLVLCKSQKGIYLIYSIGVCVCARVSISLFMISTGA